MGGAQTGKGIKEKDASPLQYGEYSRSKPARNQAVVAAYRRLQ
jgi:hypothetical protein